MSPSDRPLSPLTKVPLTPRDRYRVTPHSGPTLKIAHISDTHLGLRERTVYVPAGPDRSEPIEKQVTSFVKFRGLLTTLQTLDPDVIIHTGDVADRELWEERRKYEAFKESLPDLLERGLLLYVEGNHDQFSSRRDLSELFSGWDVLSLEESGPVPLADDQILVCGMDHRKGGPDKSVPTGLPQNPDGSIVIGAFHQSIRRISRSYDANADLDDLSPTSESASSYYDILLLGHMHTNTVQQVDECMLIDGGSTLGLNIPSTVGMLTFSEAGSHYQRFPLWVEDY